MPQQPDVRRGWWERLFRQVIPRCTPEPLPTLTTRLRQAPAAHRLHRSARPAGTTARGGLTGMNWTDRDPPETDPLLQMTIPHDGGGAPCRLEIDKLPDGHYRVTVGTLARGAGVVPHVRPRAASPAHLSARRQPQLPRGAGGAATAERAGRRPTRRQQNPPSAAASGNGGAASDSPRLAWPWPGANTVLATAAPTIVARHLLTTSPALPGGGTAKPRGCPGCAGAVG